MTPAERHKALRKAKQELKRRIAVPCPHCATMPVGPPPRMLLPQELCTATAIHGHALIAACERHASSALEHESNADVTGLAPRKDDK